MQADSLPRGEQSREAIILAAHDLFLQQRYSELIHSVNEERSLVDISAYDLAVQSVLDFISQRMQ